MEKELNESLYNAARFVRDQNYFSVDLSLTDFDSCIDDIRNVVYMLKIIRAVNMTVKELNDKLKKTTMVCNFIQNSGMNYFSIKFNDKGWKATTTGVKTIYPICFAEKADIPFYINTIANNQYIDFWNKQVEPKFIDLLSTNFSKITDELNS